jgi:hypothetical protein
MRSRIWEMQRTIDWTAPNDSGFFEGFLFFVVRQTVLKGWTAVFISPGDESG